MQVFLRYLLRKTTFLLKLKYNCMDFNSSNQKIDRKKITR